MQRQQGTFPTLIIISVLLVTCCQFVVCSTAVKLKSLSQQKCCADYFTDWHNILNENVHVTLCLEQEHAGYSKVDLENFVTSFHVN